MLAVNDLFYLASPVIASLFHEDVAAWLDGANIRYTPSVKFSGKSGYDHRFDFVIPKSTNQPERVLRAINRPSRNTAQRAVFSWIDTKEVRSPDSRAFAILNDSEQSISENILESMRQYDVNPILWSNRKEVREELAAWTSFPNPRSRARHSLGSENSAGTLLTVPISLRIRWVQSATIMPGSWLRPRLHTALTHLNPDLPPEVLADASRKLTRPGGATRETRNRAFHRMLVEGVTVEYRSVDGTVSGAQARVIDFEHPANNDWLAVNQFTVTENKNTRRPDILQFVNGLPMGVIELKNPTDEDATIWSAWQQLQTYKSELSTLFSMNEILMVSDGIEARIGSLTAGREWFKPWRTISGESLADPHMTELQVMLEGICTHHRFLSLVRDFIVFEEDGSGALVKSMAGYHQFHAVQVAVTETPAANLATGASAWSGTPRARARA